ncbi:MAG TPA: SLC13 family permease, partial [Ilumatobacteraceae bacterium]|nr:SLC13 family permease [Ilumatobacteraceae bacterium]
ADSTITFLILAGAVVLFVSNRVPVALVAIGVSLSLWATGILSLDQALTGFGDPTVLFIAATFVVAESLDATGVTAWIGQQLLERAGTQRSRVLAIVMVVCALITALITPNASVAALIPVVVIIAIRLRQPSSQFLMPLAFGAHAGALLALTGSPVNVLISEAGDDAGVGSFGFFEFALAGIPLLIGTVAITVFLGARVLPRRNAKVMPPDFSNLAATLVRDYDLDTDVDIYSRAQGVAEVVIPPRSGVIGQTAFPGMVTESGDLVVIAIQRTGEQLGPGEVTLAAGDSLLLRGTWAALSTHLDDDEVLTVNDPDAVRRQVVPLGIGAKEALGVLAGMVMLLATGAVPPAVAALLAAGLLIMLRVVSIDHAYRAISWTTVILVAGMIPLSTAMQTTGAARQLADALIRIVGDAGPYALLLGLFVLVAVLGQLISNTATALIVIPIAVTSAVELDISARPVLMAVNVAAAAALLTPVATPANLMVMEPGGYRFGDYWKLGLPLMAWYAVIAILLVPQIWQF